MEPDPPPPYSLELESSSSGNDSRKLQALARKPVPRRGDEQKSDNQAEASLVKQFEELEIGNHSDHASNVIKRKPVNQHEPKLDTESHVQSQPPVRTEIECIETSTSITALSAPPIKTPPISRAATATSTSSFSSQLSTTSSHLQTAYREARYFAGGLIHHPAESTKHFSILRHSHGLVFYQGTSTAVVVSIFSDALLPSNRTIWLQNKGWTGKTGMGLKSLVGRTGDWLEVTPTSRATAEQLKPSDERAWQRDISHFLKRASDHIRKTHKLRETMIVRIPVEAQDGYFRLVLCAAGNKRVLCPSPVFRILSTSASPSSIRGASLSTLPLELGAKLATTVATTVATTMAQSHVVAPITSAVQNRMPAWVEKVTTAYDVTAAAKVESAIGHVNEQYDAVRQTSFNHLGGEYGVSDEGPQPPYPLSFVGNANLGLGTLGMPVANLNKVPDLILRRLYGFYFGWARILGSKKSTVATDDHQWYQAVISALPLKISQLSRVRLEDSGKKIINVLFIDEHQEMTPSSTCSIEIRVLGFLRPHERIDDSEAEAAAEVELEAEMLETVNDVMMTQALLSRPAWGPDAAPVRDEVNGGPMGKVKSRAVESRIAAQKRVDSIPLHRAGVRVAVDETRDKSLGTGGIYIVR